MKLKLQPKLMLALAATALLSVLAVMAISLILGNRVAEHEVEQKIIAVLDARHSDLSEYLLRLQRDGRLLEVDPAMADALRDFTLSFPQANEAAQTRFQHAWTAGNPQAPGERHGLQALGDGSAYDRAHARHHPNLREKMLVRAWQDILLIDPRGNVVYSTRKKSDFGTNLLHGPWKGTGLAHAVQPLLEHPVAGVASFGNVAEYPPSGHPARFYIVPVFHPADGFLGAIAIQMSSARINELMQKRDGLGNTGETFIVGRDGWMFSDSRFSSTSTILRKQLKTEAVNRVLSGDSGLIIAPDYRGVDSYIGFRPIQVFPDALGGNARWGVIAKVDRDEALSSIASLRSSLLLVGTLVALLAVAAGLHVARTVSRPILAIQSALSRLVRGEETTVPGLERHDEIGELAQAAEAFRLLADKTARDHWIQENVASLTAIVSGESSMLHAPERVLQQLCLLLDVPVAAFYFKDGEGVFRRLASHGMARRSQTESGFRPGEGVIGQCAKDAQAVVLSPVPSGLAIISAGLAEFPPQELVVYPLLHKKEVLAVLELASAQALTPLQHEFIQAACAALGLHFANLQVSEHNLALLAETRKQSAELHASAHYARSLIEASLDPLVTISAEGKITDVNRATETATGCPRETLIGSDFADYFTEPEKARQGYGLAFSKGFVTDYPLAIRHVSGKLIDVLYNASVYRDTNGAVAGVFAAARDVTDSKRAEALLQEQQEELLQNNEEMRSQGEELKAQNEELKASQEELRAQQEEMAHKNQSLEAQGRELEFARREAEARAVEVQKASQYKSEFLANMSHELRTPLNSILILARDLADNASANLTPDQAESASVIHESGSQLLTLINDILDLSKIEANRLEVLREEFALADVLTYLRRVFSPLAEKKGIRFLIDAEPSAPAMLHGDRQRITQVLTNLLSNAVKFTESGQVSLAARQTDEHLCLDIIDTGIGIPADKLEHIFGVFQQLDGTTSRKYGGSGLGLAITRKLVELMGGEIRVTSTPGEGSCFSVRLPLPASADQSPVPAPPPDPAPAASTASHAPILVVEDDARLVRILQRLIDTLGYPVSCVDSGEKALQSIASDRPAGILLDLGLPGMSGMELLRRLKANPLQADIPVFIMSGASDTGEAKTLGAEGFLKKPVTRDVIASALQTMHRLSATLTRKRVLLVEDDNATITALGRLFQHDPLDLVPTATGAQALALLQEKHFDAVILDLGLKDMSGFDWLDQLDRRHIPHPPLVVYSARDLDKEQLLTLRAHTDAVITKGSHADERLHEEVLLALRAPPAPVPEAVVAPAGQHLLLVDDDVRNLFALSKSLRARGYTVSVAEDGAQALELLRSTRFDALLTDIMMPEMDGYELIRRVRQLGYQDLPIIAVTAKAMQGDSELCLQAGASTYLPKPVDIDRLQAILQQWL